MPALPGGSDATTKARAEVVKVAIVEDRREIREALSMLISGTEGLLRRRLSQAGPRSPFPANRRRRPGTEPI